MAISTLGVLMFAFCFYKYIAFLKEPPPLLVYFFIANTAYFSYTGPPFLSMFYWDLSGLDRTTIDQYIIGAHGLLVVYFFFAANVSFFQAYMSHQASLFYSPILYFSLNFCSPPLFSVLRDVTAELSEEPLVRRFLVLLHPYHQRSCGQHRLCRHARPTPDAFHMGKFCQLHHHGLWRVFRLARLRGSLLLLRYHEEKRERGRPKAG